jgi:hypothetical protein
MTDVLCSAGKGRMTEEECLTCALAQNNTCGYDYNLLKGIFNNPPRTGIHVTDILGCPLKAYLDKIDPQPQYVHERLLVTLGSAVHKFLEAPDENFDCEVPLTGLGLVGTADVVYKDGRLTDIKTTRWIIDVARLPYKTHVLQVNIYAHLLRLSDREVREAAIQYIDMSGPTKCRSCRVSFRMNGDGLACPICGGTSRSSHLGAVLVPVPLYDPEYMDHFIQARRDDIQAAMETGLRPRPDPSYLCSYCAHECVARQS